jgi:predicted GNAT superfamily acetyltransferase
MPGKLIIREGTIAQARQVEAQIPEFANHYDYAEYVDRLQGNTALILVAIDNGAPIAFKVGYALGDMVFYSWVGGVLLAHRRTGIATQLRVAQEEWARKVGYQTIQTKSKNSYPAMLHMLISAGYAITGVEESPTNPKILFELAL